MPDSAVAPATAAASPAALLPASGSLFADLGGGSDAAAERFDALLAAPGLRLERIVSTGQASPPDSWYDQDSAEWVVLLSGAATLRFADEDAPRALRPGDWVNIPAHCRHRLEWTDPGQPSVWLAIHYRDCRA